MLRMVSLIALLAWMQAGPGYVSGGDQVEDRFRAYVEDLDRFYSLLETAIRERAPALAGRLTPSPPAPVVFGYQILPALGEPALDSGPPITTFAYSWPITEGYVAAEETRLERARARLDRALRPGGGFDGSEGGALIEVYRELVRNQRVVDQYIQYNRFWQRMIFEDRARFDALTEIYWRLVDADADAVEAVRQVLGEPMAPEFISVRRELDAVVLEVPVYTDIEDADFLDRAKREIEAIWRVASPLLEQRVELAYRRIRSGDLYAPGEAPARGEHIDLDAHAGRFPADGAILTTGAETTHARVGRYIALGPGEISLRTLAHEFGHILGFRDGYVRGYRDLGDDGFEILELTAIEDDIMMSPRRGEVQAVHFDRLLEALEGK